MFSLKQLFVLLLISVSLAISPALSNDAIDTVLKQGLTEHNIPGVVAMTANSDGIIYRGTFGQNSIAGNLPMAEDNLFRIASMTKPITTVAVMQLVEQGKIDLDRDITVYLPQLSNLQVLDGFDADDKPILRPAEGVMTTRHLLTHTAGFAYDVFDETIGHYVELGYAASIGDGGDAFLSTPLKYDPGTKWQYGINTDWAGVLVETISGLTLDEYFKKYIFEPLKMRNSHFHLTQNQMSKLATTYIRSEDGTLAQSEPSDGGAYYNNNPFFSGGGGLVSTASDYVRFMRAILNDGILDGQRILSKQSIDEMAKNNIGELNINDRGFKFGLGFAIFNDPTSKGRTVGSIFWGGAVNTNFWIDRKNNISGVVMHQITPNGDSGVRTLLSDFEQSVYSSEK
ncbi:MAG: beta-lactamase family protein [Kordiimonadaceae bacterium]|jgi:methyl acetate hydrolase|nr:beta-lactamase family protein [Kordiimonadaceae bacterium]MBT6036951.1 beta-lactamase family protein [Kordiimonadaceae bacterium]MBT7582090.1 beta-lactamase family protein [Kordiimonadaceae bacterium]